MHAAAEGSDFESAPSIYLRHEVSTDLVPARELPVGHGRLGFPRFQPLVNTPGREGLHAAALGGIAIVYT